MLPGRLGLETARLPHSDRPGLVSLDRGRLTVEEGCLTFDCAGGGVTPAGPYGLPHQFVSLVVLGPGSSVSHDVLRLLARHGVGLVATGEDGVRFYTAQPLLPDFSHLARANRLQRRCRENDEYGNASTERPGERFSPSPPPVPAASHQSRRTSGARRPKRAREYIREPRRRPDSAGPMPSAGGAVRGWGRCPCA